MREGRGKVNVEPKGRYTVKCTHNFYVVGLVRGKPICLYGPLLLNYRSVTFFARTKEIEVVCDDRALWTVEVFGDAESLDPRPVEVPLRIQKQLAPSHEEIVRQEVRRELRERDESAVEFDAEAELDYEVYDDFDSDIPQSAYEVREMPEDEEFVEEILDRSERESSKEVSFEEGNDDTERGVKDEDRDAVRRLARGPDSAKAGDSGVSADDRRVAGR